jgi:hypothetical protein
MILAANLQCTRTSSVAVRGFTRLAPCAEGRFVPPGGEWPGAVGKLEHFGALIVTGERGTGRRTAALRLLNGISAAR